MKPNQELYLFLHIPKTAGTSLRLHLKKSFSRDEVLFLYQDQYPGLDNKEHAVRLIDNLSSDQKDKIKVIIGHGVYYGIDQLFPNRQVRYITFFRHPAARIVSRYNFSRMLLEHGHADKKVSDVVKDGKVLDFWSFVAEAQFCHNSLLTFLIRHNIGSGKVPLDQCLQDIKKILEQFYFIGLTEKSDEDFLFLAQQLGLGPSILNANVSKKFFNQSPLALRERLRVGNEIDYEIYAWAVVLNQRIKDDNFYRLVRQMKRRRMIAWPYFVILSLIFSSSEFLRTHSKMYRKLRGLVGEVSIRLTRNNSINVKPR